MLQLRRQDTCASPEVVVLAGRFAASELLAATYFFPLEAGAGGEALSLSRESGSMMQPALRSRICFGRRLFVPVLLRQQLRAVGDSV